MNGSARLLITLAIMVAVAGGAVFLAILPLQAQTSADLAATDERRAQLVKLERVARRINDLQAEIKRLESALEFFEHRLPKEQEVDVVLREITKIAETTNLKARSIRTGVPETMPRYNVKPITMTLEGTFASFYQFLLGIEQLSRITKVRQLQITKIPEAEGQVQVDMMMDIFFERDQ